MSARRGTQGRERQEDRPEAVERQEARLEAVLGARTRLERQELHAEAVWAPGPF